MIRKLTLCVKLLGISTPPHWGWPVLEIGWEIYVVCQNVRSTGGGFGGNHLVINDN